MALCGTPWAVGWSSEETSSDLLVQSLSPRRSLVSVLLGHPSPRARGCRAQRSLALDLSFDRTGHLSFYLAVQRGNIPLFLSEHEVKLRPDTLANMRVPLADVRTRCYAARELWHTECLHGKVLRGVWHGSSRNALLPVTDKTWIPSSYAISASSRTLIMANPRLRIAFWRSPAR